MRIEDVFLLHTNVASLEYAVLNGWTKMIVVMGHSDCGAVKASLKPPKPGEPTPALYELIVRIRKSFRRRRPIFAKRRS